MPNSNQPPTAKSATDPTFADDFSNTIIAYLEQPKGGARDRVNKALKDTSLFPVTRLFNEMVSFSTEVLEIEYNNFLEAEDAEDYSMQAIKAAARTILNDDFTDLKPAIANKFPKLKQLKTLCEKEKTTIVDMLLKGISALQSQCLGAALTAQVGEGSARNRTAEDQQKIKKIVSILPRLEKVQVDLTRETLLLPTGAEVKIEIDQVELRKSLTEALQNIDDAMSVIEEKLNLNQDAIEDMITAQKKMDPSLNPVKDMNDVERDNLLTNYKKQKNMRGVIEAGIVMLDMSLISPAQDRLDEYRNSLTESVMTSKPEKQRSPDKPQATTKAFLKSREGKEYQSGLVRLGAMKTAHKNAKDFETKSGIETNYIALYEHLNALEGLPAATKTKFNTQYSPNFGLFEQSLENKMFAFLRNEEKGTTFDRFNSGEGGVLSRMFDHFVKSQEVMQDTLDRAKLWQGDEEENHLKDVILKSAQKSGLFNETLTDLSPKAKEFFAGKLDLTKKFGTQQVARELLTSIKGSYIQTLTQQVSMESTVPVEKRVNERWFPLLVDRSNQITQANVFTKRHHYIATIIPSSEEQEKELKQRLSSLEQRLQEDFSSEKRESVKSNLGKVEELSARLDAGFPIDIALFNETLLKCGLDKASHEISNAIQRLETYRDLLIRYGALNDDGAHQQMDDIIHTLQDQQSAVNACVLNLPVNALQKTLDDTAAIFVNVQNALKLSPTKTTTSGIINRLKNVIAHVIEFINSCFGLATKVNIEDINTSRKSIIDNMKQMKNELSNMRLDTPNNPPRALASLLDTASAKNAQESNPAEQPPDFKN